ncbi:MAG: hypothetical protein NT157_06580 [Candidatus Micrarchaeota archaeon]|nr:hypothetical protein [Candidatus Micrarchaeota archaeon]
MEWCEQSLGCKAGEVRDAAAGLARIVEAKKEKLAELGVGRTGGRAKKFAELVGNAGSKKGRGR